MLRRPERFHGLDCVPLVQFLRASGLRLTVLPVKRCATSHAVGVQAPKLCLSPDAVVYLASKARSYACLSSGVRELEVDERRDMVWMGMRRNIAGFQLRSSSFDSSFWVGGCFRNARGLTCSNVPSGEFALVSSVAFLIIVTNSTPTSRVSKLNAVRFWRWFTLPRTDLPRSIPSVVFRFHSQRWTQLLRFNSQHWLGLEVDRTLWPK
ncbi:hypothetical protein C8R46DRAFT_1067704 [Mycena filopes]|nr:hypothetical protein C8R46DRAFT_1067704 [Mycena filopes]